MICCCGSVALGNETYIWASFCVDDIGQNRRHPCDIEVIRREEVNHQDIYRTSSLAVAVCFQRFYQRCLKD